MSANESEPVIPSDQILESRIWCRRCEQIWVTAEVNETPNRRLAPNAVVQLLHSETSKQFNGGRVLCPRKEENESPRVESSMTDTGALETGRTEAILGAQLMDSANFGVSPERKDPEA